MVNWSGNIGLILQVEEFTQKIASETLWMQKVELRTSQVSWKNQTGTDFISLDQIVVDLMLSYYGI